MAKKTSTTPTTKKKNASKVVVKKDTTVKKFSKGGEVQGKGQEKDTRPITSKKKK